MQTIGDCSRHMESLQTIRSGTPVSRRTLIKSVALPSEHGSWGFLIEPILLGMLVGATGWGGLFCLAAIGGFLAHQPIKIALKDRLKNKRVVRTFWAEWFAVGYILLAGFSFSLVVFSADRRFLFPLLLAFPLILCQLYYDARNRSRELLPELAGAAALGAIAPSIVLLAGWKISAAFLLWTALLARTFPSILYVRSRLKLEHSKSASISIVWASHFLALVTIVMMAGLGRLPWLAAVGSSLLFFRALLGLSKYRTPRRTPIIGVQEMGYGILYVILIAIGYIYAL